MDQDSGDAATEAFEGVRAEIALLRRAVEGLSAERAGIDVPDYSETLAKIHAVVSHIFTRADLLVKSPALAMTPEAMAGQIAAAGAIARREDHDALARARTGFDHAARQIGDHIVAARTADRQNRWLAGTAIGGLVLGMIVWAVFAGVVARAVPESWHWPERMAARSLAMPMWESGQRLMQVASPDAFTGIVTAANLARDNRDAIEACRTSAAKAKKAVRCMIEVKAQE